MSSSRRSTSLAQGLLILALAFVLVGVRGAGLHQHLYHHAPSQDTHAHAHVDHQHSSVFAAEAIGGGHYFEAGGIDLQQTAALARLPDLPPAVFAYLAILYTLNPAGIPAGAVFDPYLYPEHSPPPGLRPPLRAPPL